MLTKEIYTKLHLAELNLGVVLKECEVELAEHPAKKDLIKQLKRTELECHYAVSEWRRFVDIMSRKANETKRLNGGWVE